MDTHQAVSDLAPGVERRAAGRLGLPRRDRPRRVHPHRLAVERGRRPARLPYVWRQPAISKSVHVCDELLLLSTAYSHDMKVPYVP